MALKRIGDVLIQAKVITEKQLNDALKKTREKMSALVKRLFA